MATGSNYWYVLASRERERGHPFRKQTFFEKPPANFPWYFIGHNQSHVHSWANSFPLGKCHVLIGLDRGVLTNGYWGSWNFCDWLRFSSSEIHPPVVGLLLYVGAGMEWVTRRQPSPLLSWERTETWWISGCVSMTTPFAMLPGSL